MIRPPIVIVEDGSLDVFASLAAAELKLEATDVHDRVYTGYDADGRLLRFETELRKKRGLFGLGRVNVERVKIGAVEDSPRHGPELRKRLVDFLSDSGANASELRTASLKELIDKAVAIVGWTK